MYQQSPSRQSSFRVNANTLNFSLEKPSFFNNKYSNKIHDSEEINYPFKPQIHDLPTNLYKQRSKIEISKQEQLERLLDNKVEEEQKRKREKIKKQEQQIQKFCTFFPKVNSEAHLTVSEQVYERLYKEGVEKLRTKEQVKIQIQDKNLTFKPVINKVNMFNSEKGNMQPLYLRIKEELKKQQEKKLLLKQKVLSQQDQVCAQFQPNPKSIQILEKKQNFCKNVVERLMKDLREKQQKRTALIEQKQMEERQKHTFMPEINPSSANLSISFKQNFLERQQTLALGLKQKMEQKMEQIMKQQNCTFKPEINKISAFIANIQRHHETQENKIDRHYQQFQQRKKQNIRMIENQTYKECTFQPAINFISKALQADPKHHCCQRPTCVEYNFKPAINPKSREIVKNMPKKEDNNSQVFLQKIKMEAEYNEMKQCTFKPKIKNYVHKSERNLNDVQGVKNYIKMQELKKKKEEEKKKISQKVFNLEKRYDQRTQKQTRIEQFHLSKPNTKNLKDLKDEHNEQLAKECPFKPNTNKSRQKAFIHRIVY